MSIEIDHLRSWIGREEVAEDVITSVPVAALAATLDRDDAKPQSGDELPPLLALALLPAHRAPVGARTGRTRQAWRLPAARPAATPYVGRRAVRIGDRFLYARPPNFASPDH